ncbi:MAG: HlyD family efflux transporter periplasmic adaptor subunit [Bacteroidales bacterium]
MEKDEKNTLLTKQALLSQDTPQAHSPKPPMTSDSIHFRSEEVQEILGTPPRWIVRYGIGSIFAVLLILVTGSYFFKYPDILTARITITTENLPAALTSKTSGRIDTLFVSEKQLVKAGTILAEMENAAILEDVLQLEKGFVSTATNPANVFVFTENALQLGELQSFYENFSKASIDDAFFKRTQFYPKKIAAIERQIVQYRQILNRNKKQVQWSQKQLESSQKLYRNDSILYANGVITGVEYENSRTAYLQQLQSHGNIQISVNNQELAIAQQEQTILDLQQQEQQEQSRLQSELQSAKHQLQAQILQWKQQYLLIAPIDGICTFTKYWKPNQNIIAGEVLATVVPEGKSHIVGRIELPPAGAGKVKEGQMVNVKFDNYPYMEYGMVRVQIKHISLVPITKDNTKSYILEVEFPETGLRTNYGKELDFSQEMTGTAEIITEDLRLLQKLLNPIKELWKR